MNQNAEFAVQMEQWDEFIRTEQWDAARHAGEQLRQEYPKEPGVLTNWGVVALHDGRADDAERAWNRALQIESTHQGALIWMGFCALRQKRWREAYDWGHRILTVDPDSKDAKQILSRALGWIGQAHITAAEWDKVLVVAQELLRYEPDSATAHYLLGWAEIGHDAPAVRAEKHFRKSLALIGSSPSSCDATAGNISWGLGDSLYRQERFAEAQLIFRDLKRARPDDAILQNGERNALAGLVKQAMSMGDGVHIKAWSDELLVADPDSVLGWNARGVYLLQHAGQARAAIPCFQHALDHAKSSSDKAICSVNLGWAWMRLHRPGRAERAFRLAKQHNPHSNDARIALQVRRMQKRYDALLGMALVIVVFTMVVH